MYQSRLLDIYVWPPPAPACYFSHSERSVQSAPVVWLCACQFTPADRRCGRIAMFERTRVCGVCSGERWCGAVECSVCGACLRVPAQPVARKRVVVLSPALFWYTGPFVRRSRMLRRDVIYVPRLCPGYVTSPLARPLRSQRHSSRMRLLCPPYFPVPSA